MADHAHRVTRVHRVGRLSQPGPGLGRGGVEPEQRDVVVEGARVPARVDVDRGDRASVTGASLRRRGADDELELRRRHAPVDAVGRGEHPDRGDEGAAAERKLVLATPLSGDERRVRTGRRAADDVIVDRWWRLRDLAPLSEGVAFPAAPAACSASWPRRPVSGFVRAAPDAKSSGVAPLSSVLRSALDAWEVPGGVACATGASESSATAMVSAPKAAVVRHRAERDL